MLINSKLKSKLKSKKITFGSWITLGNPAVAEILAKSGFDWLVIDLEHSTMSMEQAGDLIRVIDLAGIPPLVRLTSNDKNQIKRVMDAGAHGIIVPMVNTRIDAIDAVSATRYAPHGTRGVGLARAQNYGSGFQDYLKWQKDGPIVIVQIEHKSALNCLDDILSVDGVDGFIIGPYDLSCSMGIPGEFDNPDFISTMDIILSAGKRAKKSSGLHVVEPDVDLVHDAVSKGYNFIAYSVDIRMLDSVCRIGVKNLKEMTCE